MKSPQFISIDEVLKKYEPVIGLEVHAQLLTKSKMFCSCKNDFGSEPNTNICPVCTGQPGALPVINEQAIQLGIRAALALHCEIHQRSIFSRKNYFYPDLPKGYQISQYDKPYSTHGKMEISFKDGRRKTVGITRIHFEEDAGKSTHEGTMTLVNLNRSSVPLIEIVSEPDMRSAEEAGQYLRTLRSILRYLDVCDGNMEEGNFRCDANVSIRPIGAAKFGTRAELKNINSFRFVEKAIEYEIVRQAELLDSGQTIRQQTRSWDSAKGITELMREKENAADYRYFPEPDLGPLVISDELLNFTKANMQELPQQAVERFMSQYGLSHYDAAVLTATKEFGRYYEKTVTFGKNSKSCANWVMNELLGRLNAVGKDILQSPISAEDVGGLVLKIDSGVISGKTAKQVFDEMFETSKSADSIISEKGLVQISDTTQLELVVRDVLAKNQDQVAQFKAGKEKLLGYFVGQAMKQTQGQANPGVLGELVKKILSEMGS